MRFDKSINKFIEDKRIVNSGVIVLNKSEDNELSMLLLKRKDYLHWELPGGKVELKDKKNNSKINTLKCAAIREAREEIGINFRNKLERIKPFYIDFISPGNKRRRSYNFIAFSSRYPVLENSFSDWKYVPISEFKKYKLAPNVIKLEKLIKIGLFNKLKLD